MKHLKLLLYCSLLFLPASAQLIGNQQAITIKTSAQNATQNGLLYLPPGHDTANTKYPLIIFLHGLGQIGSTKGDLSRLLQEGLPKVISSGSKIEAINPLDKRLYKFIVFSPQHWSWTTSPESLSYIIGQLKSLYKVDTNRIIITGLSAGAQGVMQSITYNQSLTNKVSVVIPMSPSMTDDSYLKRFSLLKTHEVSAWFFTGKLDKTTPPANAYRYNDSINKYWPGQSKVTIYPTGHDSWDKYYDPLYKDPQTNINIYEYALGKTTDSVYIPEPPIEVKDSLYTKILHNPKKIKKIIVLDIDGKWTIYEDNLIESGDIKLLLY